ncbi:MAG: FAD-dependent oxidoreductase, partial [Rickettsiales bacterium]|nr:FAD-dependent oxidoreductase [Rickettsiales bacterium]
IDDMSIDQYLAQAQAHTGTAQWVVDAIKMAYKGEFGAETSEQSAMLLVNQIGISRKRPFEIYGEKQDESRRIRGGNAKLIEALKAALEKQGVTIETGCPLTQVEYVAAAPRPVYLTFTKGDKSIREGFDYVVSAMPFSKLREVKGLDTLQKARLLSSEKLEAIRKLPYGNITKITFGLKGKPWKECPHMPELVNGSFRSDLPYLQNTWVSSFAQNSPDGLITVLVAGKEAEDKIGTVVSGCKRSLSQLFNKPEEDLFTGVQVFHVWKDHQFSKGSYSYYRPGQFMTLRPVAGQPELRGRMGFVGEQSDPELYGFMNGAVHSALNEALRIEVDKKRGYAGEHSAKAEVPAAVARRG